MKITESHRRKAREALSYLAKVGNSPVWKASTAEAIACILGKDQRIFLLHSNRGKLTRQTLMAVVNGCLCQHCKSVLLDGGTGNNKSLCSGCKADPSVDRIKYRVATATATNMERYGVANPYQSEEIKKKIRKTCLDRYGDTNPAGKNSSIYVKHAPRDLVELRRQRQLEASKDRYGEGLYHWSQVPKMRKAFQKSMEMRHGKGVTNVMHLESVKEKHAKRMSSLAESGFFKSVYADKIVPIMQEKYGVSNIFEDTEYIKSKRLSKTGYEFPLQNPNAKCKFADTCTSKYGVPHFMQNPKEYKRIVTSNHAFHLYEVQIRSRVFHVIGTYEIFVLSALAKRYGARDLISSFDLSPLRNFNGGRYYPDFYVASKDRYVEVKSPYTLFGANDRLLKGNRAKAKWFHKSGVDISWILPNPTKGTLCVLPTEWYTWSKKKIRDYIKCEQRAVETLRSDQFQSRLVRKFGQAS